LSAKKVIRVGRRKVKRVALVDMIPTDEAKSEISYEPTQKDSHGFQIGPTSKSRLADLNTARAAFEGGRTARSLYKTATELVDLALQRTHSLTVAEAALPYCSNLE